MVRWFCCLVVLLVFPARAAQWPEYPCRDLKAEEQRLNEGTDGSAADKAMATVAILALQREHCGVDVRAKLAAGQRAIEARDERMQALENFHELAERKQQLEEQKRQLNELQKRLN
jgi:hypothetical protein